MNEILLLNNQGVHLLQQDQTDRAIAHFTQAMYLASAESWWWLPSHNQEAYGVVGTTDTTTATTTGSSTMTVPDCPVFFERVTLGEAPASLFGLSHDDDVHFEMYNRAFLFPVHALGQVQSETVVDAVLLFNAGLAYHRLALMVPTTNGGINHNSKKESLKNAHAALRCYKCGLHLIRNHTSSSRNDDNATTVAGGGGGGEPLLLLAMATLNNLAHLYGYCSRRRDAQTCQDMLDALMETSLSYSGSSSSMSFHDDDEEEDCYFDLLSDEDAEFFVLGQFYRRYGWIATAAAAA